MKWKGMGKRSCSTANDIVSFQAATASSNHVPSIHALMYKQDYDCFYAAVFEKEDPKLRSLPLAVQQKQIIVTCNYEARRHGLYKLQRVTEARKRCPEAIIVLGEDLTRFRNASKENYNFLRRFAWSGKVERLGFDEVFVDVTDMVDYNIGMINHNSLQSSFFQLSRHDPTVGFDFDCNKVSGHTFPTISASSPVPHRYWGGLSLSSGQSSLFLRLVLGSHLAQHLRLHLEEHQGYSATVGISTSKLISKLVGNVNKPRGQTTLLPPYYSIDTDESNVTRFLDYHDIGKIPGIGFKTAQKIRDYVLGRPAAFDAGLVYGGTKESVTVKDVRLFPAMGDDLLEKVLGGSGAPKGIGMKIWGLVNGVDDSEVSKTREVPQQISIEDSYIRLDTMAEVEKELRLLSKSLLSRIRADLSCVDDDDQPLAEELGGEENQSISALSKRQWLACPRTLRLTTRPRPPTNPDGARSRTFNRVSRSCDMPFLILNLSSSVEELSERLVHETLIPLFHKLHPEKSGWNLSLMNLCATNMSLTAASARDGAGRDISKMFKTQEHVLKEWRVDDTDTTTAVNDETPSNKRHGKMVSVDQVAPTEDLSGHNPENDWQSLTDEGQEYVDSWQNDDEVSGFDYTCTMCGLAMPHFAIAAHERFHDLKD
ncbi:MAG: hypothetical protein Q9181_000591 [Wetmoreana brouardii]